MHVSTPSTTAVSVSTTTRITAALSALLLGGAIVWGALFAPQAAVHNAAHDGRHVVAAPCH